MVKTVNCSDSGANWALDSTTKTSSLPFNHLPLDTESLILSHMSLSDLSRQLLPLLSSSDLYHITELDLSYNSIKQLGHRGRNLFNLPGQHLTYLNLGNNEFKSLSSGIFYGLKRLKVLDLSNGLVKFIDERAFEGLDSLQVLNLEGNVISIIYLEIFQPILNLRVS